MTSTQLSNTSRFDALDYLRFLAAVMVVAFHWCYSGISNGKIASIDTFSSSLAYIAGFGYLGVQIFFMISGFVISKSYKRRTATEFVLGRFWRLYPTYWVALCITTVVTLLYGSYSILSVYPLQFLANLTMISGLLGSSFVDGVYWTLEYELMFYFLVFILLLIRAKNLIPHIFCIWSLVLSFIFVSDMEVSSHSYLNGYFTYFLTGALIAQWIDTRKIWLLPVLALSIISNVGYAYTGVHQGVAKLNPAVNSALIAAFIILFSILIILSMAVRSVATLSLPGARFLGGLTYPIYLLHAHVGYIFLSIFASDENRVIPYFLVAVIIFAAAWVLHVFVEQRAVPYIRSKFTLNRNV